MGAWDYKVFDDDTAYDILDDLKESSSIITDMEKYFDDAIAAEYIDYDIGCYALVCAAIIDSVVNDFPHRCDSDWYLEWTKSLKGLDLAILKPKAIKAVSAIISDKSELKELWEENEELYDLWRKDKLSILDRLRG